MRPRSDAERGRILGCTRILIAVKLDLGVGVGVLSISLAAIFIRLADAPPLTVAA